MRENDRYGNDRSRFYCIFLQRIPSWTRYFYNWGPSRTDTVSGLSFFSPPVRRPKLTSWIWHLVTSYFISFTVDCFLNPCDWLIHYINIIFDSARCLVDILYTHNFRSYTGLEMICCYYAQHVLFECSNNTLDLHLGETTLGVVTTGNPEIGYKILMKCSWLGNVKMCRRKHMPVYFLSLLNAFKQNLWTCATILFYIQSVTTVSVF